MSELVNMGLSQYGITEISGDIHNPEVVKYFHQTGHEWVDDDETPWCSAFTNWVAMKCGYERTELLNARSWLDIGTPVTKGQLGDVVIFWRKRLNSVYGHVGFFINEDDYNFWILSGNQSNKVCIQAYDKGRLLGIRRLNKAEPQII